MKKTLAVAVLATLSQPALAALKLTTYNPQEKAIFPVSSTLISGKKKPFCSMRNSVPPKVKRWWS